MIAFITAFAISFVLFIVGQADAVRPRSAAGAGVVPGHRQPLREHQPRRHRHPRRHLLRLGDRRLPAVRDDCRSNRGGGGKPWHPNRKPEDAPRSRRRRRQPRRDGREGHYRVQRVGLRLLTIGAVVLINLIAHARVRPPRPDREPCLHAVAGLEGDRRQPAGLRDGQGVHLEKELPPELQQVAAYVRDLLDEYRTYSKGKLRFEAYDPGDDKKIEEEAPSARCRSCRCR